MAKASSTIVVAMSSLVGLVSALIGLVYSIIAMFTLVTKCSFALLFGNLACALRAGKQSHPTGKPFILMNKMPILACIFLYLLTKAH